IAALRMEFERIAADPALRCVVLGAEGKGFCAGHDLKELRAHSDLAWQQQLFAECNALMVSLTALPQPVIARVHGIATAAGCQLVSMCDLAVAADTARFALPGVNVGVFCTTPAVGVVRNVARKRVMEMLLTGEPIDAATALAASDRARQLIRLPTPPAFRIIARDNRGGPGGSRRRDGAWPTITFCKRAGSPRNSKVSSPSTAWISKSGGGRSTR